MNDLNSILIEGELTGHPVGEMTFADDMACVFVVLVRGRVEGPIIDSISYLDVLAEGKLAQNCVELLSKGSRVRIVGKVRQFRTHSQSRVVIVAEHMEVKSPSGTPKFETVGEDDGD